MIHRHTISFRHALAGLIWAFKTQPNYRVHLSLSSLALFAGIFFRITQFEFLIIFVVIFGGLAFETVNTALEKTCDAVSKSFNEDIRIAKDVAAGAMLIYAIGAFIVALTIFIPHLLNLFNTIGG